MRQCRSCQAEIPPQARFCTTCGARQPDASMPDARSDDDTDVDRPAMGGENATAILDPLIGRTIGRNYRIEALLGVGGMGKVYRATQLSLDKTVALKLLHPQYTSDENTVHRFHREARAASRLEHPNIITILDFGQDADGTLYMAMELLRGRDLYTLLQREGRLDEVRAARVVAQVCAALTEAHQKGVIHRDLKLTNIVVEDRPERPDFVKLFDFGIAKVQRPGGQETRILTTSGVVCGTPEYMSPEQIRGQALDPRSDIYSLGVVLFQLVTADFPFKADSPIDVAAKHVTMRPPSPRQFRPELSAELEAVILRCLEKKPDRRFGSAAELGQALTALAEQLSLARPQLPPAPEALAPRLEPVDDANARADTLPDPLPEAAAAPGPRTESIELTAAAEPAPEAAPEAEHVTVTVARPAPARDGPAEARPVPPPVTLDGERPAAPVAAASAPAAAAPAAREADEEEEAEPAATRTVERVLVEPAAPAPLAPADEVSAALVLPQPPLRLALIGAVLVAVLLTAALALVSLWRELREGPVEQAQPSVDAQASAPDAAVVVSAASSVDAGAVAVAVASVDAAVRAPRPAPVDAAVVQAPRRRADAGAAAAVTARDPGARSLDAGRAAAEAVPAGAVAARPGRLDKRRLFDLLQKGDIRHEAGDYEGALEFYEKALKLTDSDPRVYQKLALAYHNLGRFAESCTALGTFLRLQPHPPGEDYYRALILRNCQ